MPHDLLEVDDIDGVLDRLRLAVDDAAPDEEVQQERDRDEADLQDVAIHAMAAHAFDEPLRR